MSFLTNPKTGPTNPIHYFELKIGWADLDSSHALILYIDHFQLQKNLSLSLNNEFIVSTYMLKELPYTRTPSQLPIWKIILQVAVML